MNPETIDLLRGTAIFEDLDESGLQQIQERLIMLQFEPGDLVFREGAPGRYVCFVVDGELEVLKDTEGGASIPIASLGPGRSMGEMSIIDGLTCSATVITRKPSRVLALTRDDFERLVDEEPRLGAQIYRGISKLLSISLRKTSEDLAAERAR